MIRVLMVLMVLGRSCRKPCRSWLQRCCLGVGAVFGVGTCSGRSATTRGAGSGHYLGQEGNRRSGETDVWRSLCGVGEAQEDIRQSRGRNRAGANEFSADDAEPTLWVEDSTSLFDFRSDT